MLFTYKMRATHPIAETLEKEWTVEMAEQDDTYALELFRSAHPDHYDLGFTFEVLSCYDRAKQRYQSS